MNVAAVIAIILTIVTVSIAFHIGIKDQLKASMMAATVLSVLAMLGWSFALPTTGVQAALLMGIATFPAALLIALGIGIPFNRRRDPMPPEGRGSALERMFTRRIPVLEILLLIVAWVLLRSVVMPFFGK